jgi:glycosyltransferase involved in cell wall biosynthesis
MRRGSAPWEGAGDDDETDITVWRSTRILEDKRLGHLLCVGGEDHALRIPFMLALRERGFRLSAASSGNAAPFLRAGLDFHPLRFERFVNPLADWSAIGALARMFDDVRPNLVQCFDTKLNLLVPFAARGSSDLRVVRTINGLGWIHSSRSPLALVLRPVFCALHRLAARTTALTVFQNRDDKAFFESQRMVAEASNLVIPGAGIDLKRFEEAVAAGPSPDALRQSLGLGDNPVVITVSRLTRQKGIATLLKAAALVNRDRPNVRFLLVGPRESEGPLAISQAEIDRHAPYVMALGPRSDIPSLLRLADVFAFPTAYREGVPRALLEAATACVPIVTTDMPGCRDLVRDGWNGCVVPARAPRQMATKVLDLLRDKHLARAMGERAAKLVRQQYSLDHVVARYAAVYADLLERPVGRRFVPVKGRVRA